MKYSMIYYNQHASGDCPECNGTGIIRFFFENDSTEDAPCPLCFPDEKSLYDAKLNRFYAPSANDEA
ncbi:MAG: hypothetical protein WAP74_00450 [Patescibacteria group bacterium]